jgi:hypothetical protein
MNADITYMLAMSCVLPALVGIYRYNKIDRKYHPFIYMMILTALIETIFYLAEKFPAFGRFPRLAVNVYMLVNFLLFLYFVYINGYLGKKMFPWLIVAASAVFLANFIYEQSILKTFIYLLCFVSALMLIISIDILSRQTMAIKYKLVNNCWFWISSSSIVYNAFTLLIFGLYFFAMRDTPKGKAIGVIQHFANALCYIFFAVAMLKIPEKK